MTLTFSKESGGTTNRWHEQYRYAYDAAGNLSNRVANVLTNVFHVDNLNQLTSVVRTNSSLTVAGHVLGTATSVTVADNGNSPVAAHRYADGAFARTNVTALNGTNTFVAVAQDADGRADTNAVTTYLPVATTFLYDLNGNMRTNGSVVYAYDDENQLVAITNAGAWASVFQYDGKLRRRVRREFSWSGGAWVQTNEVRYVYDGNLPIQERDSFNVPKLSVTRGSDLSGSRQGAGGIGGLLARTDNATLAVGGTGAHLYFHADGNGNITALIDAVATVVAQYLYDPYGNTLSASGPAAEANLYRFSSKELHPASGLVYYLYRYYAPDLQRWPNRDPIAERGGLNIYSFVGNSPIGRRDSLGLAFGDSGFPGSGIAGPIFTFCRAVKDRTCNSAVGVNVLIQLRNNGIDGNDDAGGGNAFRHCIAACQSSKTCGEDSAKSFWNGREDGSTAAGRQDLANNGVGFSNASQSSCWDACMNSWRNGGLTCGNGPCPAPPGPDPDSQPPVWDDIFPPGGIN